ncbi:SCO family protein [Psychromarinibacter sp. S121]|uniref:SCO family protein n=1 Tax=Psychromarinibacter sp. S121 TaxID=3415127 RepID=UPI003C7D3DE1
MSRNRIFIGVLWGLAAIALLAFLYFRVVAPQITATVSDGLGIGDYELVTTEGEPFTEDSLKGGPTAVFFGFTHCPEVCPTTLGEVAGWQDELAADGEELRVFFVTVDPERDTAEVLGDYVGWVPGTVGVTGSPEEVKKAEKAFRIYSAKVPLEGGDYTMDHSAMVLLFDENGRFFEPVGYGEDFDRAVAKIRRMIGA